MAKKAFSERSVAFRNFLREQREVFRGEKLSIAGLIIVGIFIVLAITGPYIVPYEPYEAIVDEWGLVPDDKTPSREHWFGITRFGFDVFSTCGPAITAVA